MVDRSPVEPRAEILLHAAHELARERREIDIVLGRHDEAELVSLAPDGIGQAGAIHGFAGAIEPPLGTVALHAVALDVREV